MKNIAKITFTFLLSASLFLPAPKASAELICRSLPVPNCDFAGIFSLYKPVCTNGALVVVTTPITLVLLVPYVPLPIWPIVPVFKFAGPIPGSSTLGKFIPGGVCLVPTPLGIVPVGVMGTITQIGTSLEPTPYIPQQYGPIWF